MAAGDWASGSVVEIDRGTLPELVQGRPNVVDVYYFVRVPSGAKVANGGRSDPFRYTADANLSIAAGGLALVQALANYEGVPVSLTDGHTIQPQGRT